MNNDLKVVVFNSPPRLGKGVSAEHMINLTNSHSNVVIAHHRGFKDSLFQLCAAMYGITVEEFLHRYDSKNMGSPTGWHKDFGTHTIDNNTLSQRDSLIHMSENIIKPVFGKDSFGKAMVASLPESGIVFVSDGGFAEELIPVIDHVGGDNVLVVRIHREGVDFAGDSRSYLETKDLGSACVQDIDNDGTLEEFLVSVENAVGEWLNNCKNIAVQNTVL